MDKRAEKPLHPLAQALGTKIRQLRKARGMKQDALANEAGYGSRSAIASIEAGMVLPSLNKVLDIAHALGVAPGMLLDGLDGESQGGDDPQHSMLFWSRTRRTPFTQTLRMLADELDMLDGRPDMSPKMALYQLV